MLGDRLRELRTETFGVSLERLADLVGVSRTQLSRVERGLRFPSSDLLADIDALAALHGVESGLMTELGIEEKVVRDLQRFLLGDASEARKASVRRMVHVLLRME